MSDEGPTVTLPRDWAPAQEHETVAEGDDDAPAPLETTGRYRIEGEVGHGGLGRVYQAWDKRLGRRVAIKELMPGKPFAERRFLREAMITAELEHPSIVPVHDVGRLASGQPFYAMKQVTGDSLAQVVANKAGRAERLALLPHVVAIADAMAYAHDKRVIHRDLKPQNVLIGQFGETHVIDWGLAKRLGDGEPDTEPVPLAEETPGNDDLTRAGAIVGTPAYMPLEQALGRRVDERADVYAIGAILYFVLSGRAPYPDGGQRAKLRALEAGPPPAIASIEPETPRELAAIVDKAMAREAGDRYPTARELAADLLRFQTGQIVGAHTYSTREMLARWVRRYRAPLAAIAVMLVVLAVFGVLSVRAIAERGRRAEAARAIAVEQSQAARHRAAEVLREGASAALARGEPLEARAKLRSSLEIEDATVARALWHALEAEPLVWKRDLGAAIYKVAFSPDGTTIAAASQDHSIYLIDAETQAMRVLRGQPDQVTGLAWAPDGQHLATGSWSGDIRLWDLRDGSARVLTGHTAATWALAFAPDGATLVSGSIDKTIRIWDVARGAALRVLTGHDAEISRVVVSSDGERIVSCSTDATIRIWTLATGAPVRTLTGHTAAVPGCDISRDGRTIASASWDGTVRLWDAATGAALRTLEGHHGQLQTVMFSPDGARLASGGADHDIVVWKLDGTIERRLAGDYDRIDAIDWSPDGRWLASGGNDNTVRLWSLEAAGGDAPASGHALPVVSVTFSPDGKKLASASYDKTVRIWDVASGAQLATMTGHTQRTYSVAFTPDGTRVVSGSGDGTARVWEVASGRELARFEHGAQVYGVAVSRDGRLLLTGGTDGIAKVWDLASGRTLAVLRGHTDRIYGVTFSADARLAATAAYDDTVRIWDVATGRTLQVLRGHTDVVDGVAFTPDGRTLVSGAEDHTIRVWDVATGKGRLLASQPGRVYRISLDPGGTIVGASGSDGLARLWPLAGGAPIVLAGHLGEVDDVAFSPDGAQVATSSDDGTVRLWDARTGRPAWRAVILWRGALYGHRGWDGTPPPDSTWRTAVEKRGAHVEVGADDALCMATLDGHLERWDTGADRLLWSEDLAAGAHVVALPGGCAALAGGEVRLWSASGPRVLADHAAAIAWDGASLLVAGDRDVTGFDATGERRQAWDGAPGVTALTRAGANLVLGFANGGVEVGALQLRETPSSPVVLLQGGPASTIVVGFANGTIGLWDPATGAPLVVSRVHGAIAHVDRVGDVLDVASELGAFTQIDLASFTAPYCDVLRAVWKGVPVVWEGGLVTRRAAPTDHTCAK